jgi:hypothetical protein
VVKRRVVAIQMISHRAYRLEVLDEVGAGWRVVLHPPPGSSAVREVLRTVRLDGLGLLLADARARVEELRVTDAPRQRSD